jgi:hypothetical protein
LRVLEVEILEAVARGFTGASLVLLFAELSEGEAGTFGEAEVSNAFHVCLEEGFISTYCSIYFQDKSAMYPSNRTNLSRMNIAAQPVKETRAEFYKHHRSVLSQSCYSFI